MFGSRSTTPCADAVCVVRAIRIAITTTTAASTVRKSILFFLYIWIRSETESRRDQRVSRVGAVSPPCGGETVGLSARPEPAPSPSLVVAVLRAAAVGLAAVRPHDDRLTLRS